MKKLLALFVVAMIGLTGYAQDNEFNKMMREMYQDEFIDVVNENMNLNEEQNALFQPIFQEFLINLGTVMDAKLATQGEFSKYFESMTDEQSIMILKEVKTNTKNYTKLISKYTKKVSKATDPQTAFRFFLIVEKVKSTIDYSVIQNIPLVKN